MNGPAIVQDQEDCLNVLEQQASLNNLYTQICFCFPVTDPSSHGTSIETLTGGLGRLSANFPWVAGQIMNEGAGEGNTGTFSIRPLDKVVPLVVKDLRDDPSAPTMDMFRQAKFPFSMLDEDLICPRKTIPSSPEEYAGKANAVFLVQATFISGGLLLTFTGSHNVMDMTGQGVIIEFLNRACRGEAFTDEELSAGNIPRRDLIPLLDDSYKPGSELAYQIVSPNPTLPTSNGVEGETKPSAAPKCSWAYFAFSQASLVALKSQATQHLSSGYISTDDVLSAFIWQSITRARQPRLDLASEAAFARAVDVRRYLSISPLYTGLMQNMTYHKYPLQQLLNLPLGAIASNLRAAVDPQTSTLAHDTRALATFLARSADKTKVSFTATLDPGKDIMLSSWSKLDSYALDFNLGLGEPEAVRRPRFVPFESLIYLMPRRLDGEVAVAICLREEDLVRLKEDREFAAHATYIG